MAENEIESTLKEEEEEGSFAELFEQSVQKPGRGFSPGDRVSGIVVKISPDTVFVDLGGKSEGVAEAQEFRDDEGKLTIKEGDPVELRVSSLRHGIHLSKAVKVRGAEAVQVLRDAFQNQIPVEGRVAAVNKGGFEVEISGLRGFCPISQIDIQYCERPEEHVGARYQFRILELKERGRNIILSRRALLQEEQEKKIKETLAVLKPDLELEGRVTKVADFGAFVDIGGIEGMVHVSEITHARVEKPSDILQPGQTVRVKILRIEPEKNGRRRIALSMKALELGPLGKGPGVPGRGSDLRKGFPAGGFRRVRRSGARGGRPGLPVGDQLREGLSPEPVFKRRRPGKRAGAEDRRGEPPHLPLHQGRHRL